MSAAAKLAVAALAGVYFSAAVLYSGVWQPRALRAAAFGASPLVSQFFASAAGSSAIAIGLTSLVFPQDVGASSTGYRAKVGVPATVVGALMLGVGMAFCGGFPSTLAVGSVGAVWTAAGALLGATAFAYMHSSLAPLTNAMPIRRNPTLPEVVGLPLGVLGPAVGVVLCGWALSASGALDGGAGAAAVTFGDMLALRYGGPAAPALGGLLVGCIQPPLMLALHKNAGASSTFVTLLANALPALGVRSAANNAYFLKKKEGLGNAWQVVFCVAIAAAASFLAGGSRAGVDPLREPLPPSGPLLSFVGGALVLFGSRLGSGCTSGHCMSGAGHLAIRSLAALLCMLVGIRIGGMLLA